MAPFTWQLRGFSDDIWEDSFSYGFVTLRIEPWVLRRPCDKSMAICSEKCEASMMLAASKRKNLELLRFVNERIDIADLSRGERRWLALKHYGSLG